MEQKNTKKILILGILILIIIPIWIRAFKKPGSKVTPPASSQAVTAVPVKGAVPKVVDIIQDKKREEARKKRMFLPWSRDPFIAQGKLKKKGPSKPVALTLSGIIWDETAPAAIISDNIVKVGDEIQGKKIIKINKDKVILEEDGEQYILRLEE